MQLSYRLFLPLRATHLERGGGRRFCGNRCFFQPCEISKKIFAEMPKGNALALRKRRIGRSRHFSFPVRDNKNAGKPRSKNSPQYEACAHLGLGKRRLTALRKTRLRPRELRVLRMRAGGFFRRALGARVDGGDRGELRRDFVGFVGRERELEKADAGNFKFCPSAAPVHEHRRGDRYSAV